MNEIDPLVEQLVEISFEQEDDFLKIRETLSRIVCCLSKEQELFQSCHILHKRVSITLCISKNYLHLMANQPT